MTALGREIPASALLEMLQKKARLLRIHSLRMTTAAGSGHPTSCLSAAELVAATFFHAMKFDRSSSGGPPESLFTIRRGPLFNTPSPLSFVIFRRAH